MFNVQLRRERPPHPYKSFATPPLLLVAFCFYRAGEEKFLAENALATEKII